MARHPLLDILLHAAEGVFPSADGTVTHLPALDHGLRAIVALTGCSFIASEFGPEHFDGVPLDGFGGATHPAAQLRLADGHVVGSLDETLVARGTGAGSALPETTDWDSHHRVHHAHEIRTNVAVYGDERGFVTLADGLAGRREMGVELESPASDGVGRWFIEQALATIGPNEWLFAAVAAGNARSLRSFLACGFTAIGAEVITHPETNPTNEVER